jgi:hypothetical protein
VFISTPFRHEWDLAAQLHHSDNSPVQGAKVQQKRSIAGITWSLWGSMLDVEVVIQQSRICVWPAVALEADCDDPSRRHLRFRGLPDIATPLVAAKQL